MEGAEKKRKGSKKQKKSFYFCSITFGAIAMFALLNKWKKVASK
jgi:hypothetical protein